MTIADRTVLVTWGQSRYRTGDGGPRPDRSSRSVSLRVPGRSVLGLANLPDLWLLLQPGEL